MRARELTRANRQLLQQIGLLMGLLKTNVKDLEEQLEILLRGREDDGGDEGGKTT